MKAADFNRIYKRAQTVDIRTDEWFNFAGFFWLGLTDKQYQKMIDLLKAQGAPVVPAERPYIEVGPFILFTA